MNERVQELAKEASKWYLANATEFSSPAEWNEKFVELIIEDMYKKVIASILITDVVMEEKGQVPTSEDYIQAINKVFGVEKWLN